MDYFFETSVKCKTSNVKDSTHIAIVNAGKIRYLIYNNESLQSRARKVLSDNISSYSNKLNLLMSSLTFIPTIALKLIHIGTVVSVVLPEEIENTMNEFVNGRWPNMKWGYNIIVGSYVEKQKMVIQCFTENENDIPVYFKICSNNARKEIENETRFLSYPIHSDLFKTPKLCYSKLQRDGALFNIQVTEEFSGDKVEPELTPEIYRLFKEISSFKKKITSEGKQICFSHGDFVPWNMKRSKNGFIIFDWEYCGMRFYGFDLIHYLWQIHNKLMGQNDEQAIYESIRIAKSYDEYLRLIPDEDIKNEYFAELRKQFGNVL